MTVPAPSMACHGLCCIDYALVFNFFCGEVDFGIASDWRELHPVTKQSKFAIGSSWAEDESCVIGIVIGVARTVPAFTATSGPGISLMQELLFWLSISPKFRNSYFGCAVLVFH